MKIIGIAIVAMVCAYTSNDPLAGSWQRVSATNGIYRVSFTPDNTFQMFVNDQLRVTGTYTLNDSIVIMDDSGCPDMTGTYKLSFFGNGDSCRVQVIGDPCDARVQQAHEAVLFRLP
jgi:hypothetical protein